MAQTPDGFHFKALNHHVLSTADRSSCMALIHTLGTRL
jgi:hypothetical protein